jgi:hypothetical protein
MRSFLCVALALLGLGAEPGRAADRTAEASFAWHFNGLDALGRSNPGATFNEVLTLTNSIYLGYQMRAQLNSLLPGWLGFDSKQLSGELLTPLVTALMKHESALEISGKDRASADWVLAVALEDGSSNQWNAAFLNIGRRLGLGEPVATTVEGLKGWAIPPTAGGRGFTFVTSADWLLAAAGFDEKSAGRAWARKVAAHGRPVPAESENWLTVSVRPEFLNWHPDLPFTGPITGIAAAFSWQGKDIRTRATLTLARDLPGRNVDWTIPKGIVRDPVTSFTAIRGAHTFLGGLEIFKGLPESDVPDQWFRWSLGSAPFVDDFAMPVHDATNAFAHLEKSIPAAFNPWIMKVSLGQWRGATNRTRLLWEGLPLFYPYLDPANDDGKAFLRGGIFPLELKTNQPPAPAELFAQFEARKDLCYYDWEIAQPRLESYERSSPFIALFIPTAPARKNTFAESWLKEMSPKLGNIITEMVATSSRELSLTRKSQVGMTAIELWLFTRWLDSEAFPQCPYGMPQPRQNAAPAAHRPVPPAERVTLPPPARPTTPPKARP